MTNGCTKCELIRVAALIEGEGSLYTNCRPRVDGTSYWVLEFGNGDPRLVEEVRKTFAKLGQQVYDYRISKEDMNRQPSRKRMGIKAHRAHLRVRLYPQPAVYRALQALEPYMIGEKKYQARRALRDIERRGSQHA